MRQEGIKKAEVEVKVKGILVVGSCSAAVGKGKEVKGWREKEKGQIIHNQHGNGHGHDDGRQMSNDNELSVVVVLD